MRRGAILGAAALALALPGCGVTPYGDAARAFVRDQGREAAAAALENIEWALCRAIPMGALRDRYGRSAELTAAYNALCGGELLEGPDP